MFRNLFILIASLFYSCSYLDISKNTTECNIQSLEIDEQFKIYEPNILLIITDDQRYDALGFIQQNQEGISRYPWLETPNLDKLADEGVVFRNAFVPISICSPNRASILTGQYPNNHGILDNHTEFRKYNFSNVLSDAGYNTAYFGKWHMGTQKGNRPGFKKSYSFIGQGEYFNTSFQINNQIVPTIGWVDDVSTNLLLDELKNIDDDPFCFVIGYKTSHGPWSQSPDNVKGMYSAKEFIDVPNLESIAPYRNQENAENFIANYENEYYNKDRKYFENITAMDKNIGRIVQQLEKQELTDNTVVIFTSDNGIYHGEHTLRDKRTAYEESIRIPLIIKYGGSASPIKESDQIVLSLDLASTILDIAEVDCNGLNLEGFSLLPAISGLDFPNREAFVYQYYPEEIGPQVTIECLRTKKYKYTSYTNNSLWNEIYNLENDPYETNNLIGNDSLNTILKKRLADEKKEINL